jgi:hypothetical protein
VTTATQSGRCTATARRIPPRSSGKRSATALTNHDQPAQGSQMANCNRTDPDEREPRIEARRDDDHSRIDATTAGTIQPNRRTSRAGDRRRTGVSRLPAPRRRGGRVIRRAGRAPARRDACGSPAAWRRRAGSSPGRRRTRVAARGSRRGRR